MPEFLLVLWLLPCALYDQRNHEVPNWLTLPALPLALWWAAENGTLPLALSVLAATYIAFLAGGMGGADGKMAAVQAAISPAALLATGLLLVAMFITMRLRRTGQMPLPAGLWFFVGALLVFAHLLLSSFPVGAFL